MAPCLRLIAPTDVESGFGASLSDVIDRYLWPGTTRFCSAQIYHTNRAELTRPPDGRAEKPLAHAHKSTTDGYHVERTHQPLCPCLARKAWIIAALPKPPAEPRRCLNRAHPSPCSHPSPGRRCRAHAGQPDARLRRPRPAREPAVGGLRQPAPGTAAGRRAPCRSRLATYAHGRNWPRPLPAQRKTARCCLPQRTALGVRRLSLGGWQARIPASCCVWAPICPPPWPVVRRSTAGYAMRRSAGFIPASSTSSRSPRASPKTRP
jgi:hypothetical protein